MPDERTDPTSNKPAGATLALAEGQHFFRHFMLKRFLGRGPLGIAWLAHHEGMGRDLTVRFLPEPWLYDERILAALRGAVVRLLEFTHANLVRVFDFVREERAAAIVTEFVDGESLQEIRVRQPQRCFEVDDLRPWIAQLCEVLDYTHRYHEAVHGDLSPGVLLLTKRGDLKVADFGLVRSLYEALEHEDTGSVAGTLAYISPERARGLPCSVADDIYGFGATLYDLLTSRPPFFRGNIFLQLEQAVPPSMAGRREEFGIAGAPLPAEWEEVVAACLAKRPEDRPQSIQEVGIALGLMERHTPRPVAPPPPRVTGPTVVYPSSMPTMGAPPVTIEEVTVRSVCPASAEVHVGEKIFGRYVLQREIGRGAASVVWLAHDEEQQCPVAVKLLPDLLAHDREAMDDLALEARRAGALIHPNIVRLFDFAQGAEGAAIVMEYVDGEGLATIMKRRAEACFQVREIERWARDLASGLAHAHEAGLVHRDVQPANLLIKNAGILQLTGFGTARSASDSMSRVSMSGSNVALAYLSPEQALGEPPSAADDIYAFGATVYELLTGRPPFYTGNLLHQLGTTVPPPMSVRRTELGGNGEPIPVVWEEVVAACLAKRAQDRPKTMKDITEQLSSPESPAATPAPESAELRAAIRKIISSGEPAEEKPAAEILAPEELRSVIRKMVGSAPAESPQTVLGAEELRGVIRKMLEPAATVEPASGALGSDELRSVVRKMIADGPSEETSPAPHVTLQPDELREVIRKMVGAGAPAADAPTPLSMPAEELRAVIRNMIGTGGPETTAPASGALGPEELRSVIRQMIGTPATEQPAADQKLGAEELRGVIRKMMHVEPIAANPAALAPEELRSIVRKMVGDAVPAAPAPPAEQPLGAAELRAIIAKMVPAAPPEEERTIPAVPPKLPEPSANDSSAEVTQRVVTAKTVPPPPELDADQTMVGAKGPPPLPRAKPAPVPADLDLERTMPGRREATSPPPAPKSVPEPMASDIDKTMAAAKTPPTPPVQAVPPPIPSSFEKTLPSLPKSSTPPPPITEPVRAAVPPSPRPPVAPPAPASAPPPIPAAAKASPPPVPPPAPTMISNPVSPASMPPTPSSSPPRKSSLPVAALIGGGLFLVVLIAGGTMWMKHGKSAQSGDPGAPPVTESPVVVDAPPVGQPPNNPPLVKQPAINPPPAGTGTVAVSQLADLASKGPLREAVYLVGEFKTTSAQGNSAVFRPTGEANGALAGQVRVDALYAEGAVLPAEDSRVTMTAGTRCRVLSVRRGVDNQINVEARMEK